MHTFSPIMSIDRNEALARVLWIDQFTGTVQRIIPELTAAQARELSEWCHPNACRLTPKSLSMARE